MQPVRSGRAPPVARDTAVRANNGNSPSRHNALALVAQLDHRTCESTRAKFGDSRRKAASTIVTHPLQIHVSRYHSATSIGKVAENFHNPYHCRSFGLSAAFTHRFFSSELKYSTIPLTEQFFSRLPFLSMVAWPGLCLISRCILRPCVSDDPEAFPRTLRQRYASHKNEPYRIRIRRVSTVLNVTTPNIF